MSLSDVTVATAISGTHVATLAKTELNGNNVILERVAIDTDQLVFATPPIVINQTGAFLASVNNAIACEGKSKILIKVEYSSAGTSASFRVVLLDFSATTALQTFLPSQASVNTTIQTGVVQTNYYHGETCTFSVNGAKSFLVQVVSVSGGGNVYAWGAAV